MRPSRLLVSLILFLLGYLLFWPTPIDPLPYEPPESPEMTGPLAPNTLLREAVHIGTGALDGPEDLALDQQGNIYCGLQDGRIMKITPEGKVTPFVKTEGRPLGMAFDAQGHLIVADAWKGLLSIDPAGSIKTLTTESNGKPFRFTDDLDIASDGMIYFSDASDKFFQDGYLYDLLEARPNGRLMRYDPERGTTTTLLKDLYFANGVALSENEDFLLINETYRYRITRYWLKGPEAGNSEIFIDNLPGFPDNLSSTGEGRFWVALFTVRNPTMDQLHPRPFLKNMLARLPKMAWPKPAPYGFVLEIDEAGNILRSLQDPGGEHLHTITSVKEINGQLYMGSLYNDRIGVLPLSD